MDAGWELLSGSHCRAASSQIDQTWQVNKDFPQKHSMYLVHGVTKPPPKLLVCNNDCLMRLSNNPHHHRVVVCKRKQMLPDQKALANKALKGRIPYYVWHQLWVSNCRRRHLTTPRVSCDLACPASLSCSAIIASSLNAKVKRPHFPRTAPKVYVTTSAFGRLWGDF